jgi:hypothetical protein
VANRKAKTLLDTYKKNKSYIVLEDFWMLCGNLANNDLARARDILQVFGYGPDLSKAESSDKSIDEVDKLKEKAHKLPRYMISNNKGCIKTLFALLSKSKSKEIELRGNVSNAALNLLFRLSISKKLFTKVLNAPKTTDSLIKTSIFSNETPYESMYQLFLAALIFFDASDGDVLQLRNELPLADRSKWITEFLSKKGFTWAMNTLMALKGKVEENGISVYLIALLSVIEGVVMTILGNELKKPLEIYEDESVGLLLKGPAEIINVEKLKAKQKSTYFSL